MARVSVAVVVPVFNERGALPTLLAELEDVCGGLGRSFELVFVDDGSTDGSRELLERWARERAHVALVRLRRNFGKSAALQAGFQACDAETVVTIDGDGQDDPAEIPALIAKLEQGFDLVSGWKRERRDPVMKRIPSKLFNWVTGRLSGTRLHDLNCGLKAYSASCARSLDVYGELHRFIPVIAAQAGWRVTELPVHHRARREGRSKFGFERYARGMFDLVTVLFMGRYQQRPLHFFGGIGLAMLAMGIGILVYLVALKISGEPIGERPVLQLGVLLSVVGIQFLTFGLLAQMLSAMRHEGSRRRAAELQVEAVVGRDQEPPRDRPDPAAPGLDVLVSGAERAADR